MNMRVDPSVMNFATPVQADDTVSLFDFNGQQVRVVMIDAKPWFVTSDVADLLYGRRTSLNEAHLMDADERMVLRKKSVPDTLIPLFPRTGGRTALLSESGLYKLVLRSDKPEAKSFQDWVTRTVLPSIREDGGYILGQENMTPDQFIRAVSKFAGKKVAGTFTTPLS